MERTRPALHRSRLRPEGVAFLFHRLECKGAGNRSCWTQSMRRAPAPPPRAVASAIPESAPYVVWPPGNPPSRIFATEYIGRLGPPAGRTHRARASPPPLAAHG